MPVDQRNIDARTVRVPGTDDRQQVLCLAAIDEWLHDVLDHAGLPVHVADAHAVGPARVDPDQATVLARQQLTVERLEQRRARRRTGERRGHRNPGPVEHERE